jgi:hypothetical protein
MKRTHLTTGILAVAISALGYWGCSKDSSSTTTQNTETTTQEQARETFFKVQEPANAEEIRQKISSFRNRIIDLQKGNTNNKDRDNRDLSIDGVEWGLEAILNATYAHADFPVGEQSIRETKITVPTENGQLVDDRALLEAYDQAYKGFLDHYNSLTTEVRVPILIDIDKVEQRESKERSAVATYTMTTVYATSTYTSTSSPANCTVVTSGSDWVTSTTILRNEINQRKTLPYGHAFFVSNQFVGQFHPGSSGGLNPDLRIPGDVEDNYRDYSFFLNRTTFPNYNAKKNLTGADINWYYCAMVGSIQQYAPSGKIFSNLFLTAVEGALSGSVDNGLPKDKHVGIPFYGISMTCSSAPSPCSPTTPIANCYNC